MNKQPISSLSFVKESWEQSADRMSLNDQTREELYELIRDLQERVEKLERLVASNNSKDVSQRTKPNTPVEDHVENTADRLAKSSKEPRHFKSRFGVQRPWGGSRTIF